LWSKLRLRAALQHVPWGESIFTEADTEAALRIAVQDAVHCHFDEGKSPKVIRLHFVRDELLAA